MFNPLREGVPEGSPSPQRAGTGCEPEQRQGGGEASGGRPPPHIWDLILPAPDAAPPPPPEPRANYRGAQDVQSVGPGRPGSLSRSLRDSQVLTPAPGPLMPSASS